MADNYTPAPAPSKAEFNALSQQVDTLNVKISNKIGYVNITFSTNTTITAIDASSAEVTGLPTGAIPLCASPYNDTVFINSSLSLQYYYYKWYVRIVVLKNTIPANTSCTIRVYYYIP